MLAGLAIGCALGPLLDRVLPADSEGDRLRLWLSPVLARPIRALEVLGAVASLGAGDVVASSVTATRPPVALAPSAVPAVGERERPWRRSSGHRRRGPPHGTRHRQDLVIEHDAIRQQTPELAATAAAGPPLDSILNQIDAARHAGQFAVPSCRFDRTTVVLVPDRKNPQAPPGIGVDVRGTVQFDTSGDGHRRAGHEQSTYARMLLLVLAGGHYLIASDGPP